MTSFPAKLASPHRIVILAYPGVLLLDLAGPAQVFELAADSGQVRTGRRAYEIVTWSMAGGLVASDVGLSIDTRVAGRLQAGDTLIVPGMQTIELLERDAVLIGWLEREAPQARRICSVCVGAFLLGSAGLLDGRRAATHWRHCAELKARYPAVKVEADPIFVRDGPVWSSAGVSAGIDLALALVEEDLGHAVALDVAQRLVVYLKRPGHQAQFSRILAAQAFDRGGRFDRLHAWIAQNIDRDLSVDTMAEFVSMSPRHFARTYRERTGRTPAKAVEALRLEAARLLLEADPKLPVARVAQRCGYGDDECMRRSFVRTLGVAPAEYRERFGRNPRSSSDI